MKRDNVARFEVPGRAAMARRGAPDKSAPEMVEVECPQCDAVLCLDAALVALAPEVLCAGCETTVPLALSR